VSSCPVCGRTAGEFDVVCEADGASLVESSGFETVPTLRCAAAWCVNCGARFQDDGTGCCVECGERVIVRRTRSKLPAAVTSTVGDLAVLGSHGECDVLVTDSGNNRRLLVFGPEAIVAEEASALGAESRFFPSLVARGQAPGLGHFALLTLDIDDAFPVAELDLRWGAALSLVRSVLDAAEEMEARGFTWEPAESDLYVKAGGELVAVRARGARRRLHGEPLNAKRVLEALGGALLPSPAALGTPELVRLFVPSFNFSTATVRTVQAVRDDLVRVEAAIASKSHDSLAALCDPGLRRHHNEDAIAVAQGDVDGAPFAVLVVCDGVSSSSHAEEASAIASQVTRDRLAAFAREGDVTAEGASAAVVEAIRAAHVAVATAPIDYGDGTPPGTTIVAALVLRRRLTVGWVGDSRAYWLSGEGSELCTTDHSWINDAMARGGMSEAAAVASPFAHALTRCLGPLETGFDGTQDVQPDVRTRELPGAGHVVLCSDGLWNYFPSPSAIADLVQRAGEDADATAVARFLVCQALALGGGDNVSVAVLAVS
jgi:serine/threonine protein phosphatase PrpC